MCGQLCVLKTASTKAHMCKYRKGLVTLGNISVCAESADLISGRIVM